MHRPTMYGVPTGDTVYLTPNAVYGEQISIGQAYPFGVIKEEKINISYFRQGARVGKGNEVAHSKLAGLTRDSAIPVKIDGYYIMSGEFYQYERSGPIPNRRILYEQTGYSMSRVSVQFIPGGNQIWIDVQYAPLKYVRPSEPISVPEGTWWNVCWDTVNISRDAIRWQQTTGGESSKEAFRHIVRSVLYRYASRLPSRGDADFETLILICRDIKESVKSSYPALSKRNLWGNVILRSDAKPLSLGDGFVLDEPNSILGRGIIPVPFGAYHLKVLRQSAYLDALDKVPAFSDNSVSNIAEICDVLIKLVVTHRLDWPESLADKWLSYRYQYTTTKLDVSEGIQFLKRRSADLSKGFSCYGSATGPITREVQSAVVRCSMEMRQKELSQLQGLLSSLFTYGLSPSLYMIWDMLPYSFVVDWFIPMGEILHGHDIDAAYNRQYDISDIWYSLSYKTVKEGLPVSCYTRWSEKDTPDLNGFYTIENKGSVSNKVLGFRILDVLSLAFG